MRSDKTRDRQLAARLRMSNREYWVRRIRCRKTKAETYFKKVYNHVPLPTISHWACEQSLSQAAIDALRCRFKNVLEEVVCFLHLVPVEEICLRQLEAIEFILLHDGNAEHVRGREEPASS